MRRGYLLALLSLAILPFFSQLTIAGTAVIYNQTALSADNQNCANATGNLNPFFAGTSSTWNGVTFTPTQTYNVTNITMYGSDLSGSMQWYNNITAWNEYRNMTIYDAATNISIYNSSSSFYENISSGNVNKANYGFPTGAILYANHSYNLMHWVFGTATGGYHYMWYWGCGGVDAAAAGSQNDTLLGWTMLNKTSGQWQQNALQNGTYGYYPTITIEGSTNVSFVNFTTPLTSTRNCEYTNNTFINRTGSCTAPPIDLSACSSVSNPHANIGAFFWTPSTSAKTNVSVNFPVTGTNVSWLDAKFVTQSWGGSVLTDSSNNPTFMATDIASGLNATYKTAGQMQSTAYVYANNTYLSQIGIQQFIDCTYQVSTACNSICVNGVQYSGTYNSTTNSCTGLAYVKACKFNICGSISACLEDVPSVFNTEFNSGNDWNTTTTVTPFVNALYSPSGIFFILLIVLTAFAFRFAGEFFAMMVFTGIMFFAGLAGAIPTWIGIISGIMGAFLIVFGGAKDG